MCTCHNHSNNQFIGPRFINFKRYKGMLKYTAFYRWSLYLVIMDFFKKQLHISSTALTAAHVYFSLSYYRDNSCMPLPVGRGLTSVRVLYVYRKGVISLNHLFFMLSFHPCCSLTKKTQLQAYWNLITEEKWAKGTWSDKRTCPLLWDWSELLWNHCSGAPAASLRHSGPWRGHPVTAVRSQGHFCVHRGGGLRCVLYKC